MATKTVTEKHVLYNGEETIIFYPNSHRYKKEGERAYLIGVTTACGMKDKPHLLKWVSNVARDYLFALIEAGKTITQKEVIDACDEYNVKRDTAADVGTQIHDWIEQYVETGTKPPTPSDEKVRLGVIAFLQWVQDNKVEFEHSEKVVFSRQYGYVGKFDAVAKVNGVRTLIDYKSSKGIYLTMRYQTAAYLKAWNEEHHDDIRQRMILKLGKEDGDFLAVCFDDAIQLELDFKCFLACLLLKEHDKAEYNWQREINSVPTNTQNLN